MKAEELTRAALQGFFDDPSGFSTMDGSQRKRAVKRVEDKLSSETGDRDALRMLTLNLAKARKAHDEAKSDRSRNIATGQALYVAQHAFDVMLDELAKLVLE